MNASQDKEPPPPGVDPELGRFVAALDAQESANLRERFPLSEEEALEEEEFYSRIAHGRRRRAVEEDPERKRDEWRTRQSSGRLRGAMFTMFTGESAGNGGIKPQSWGAAAPPDSPSTRVTHPSSEGVIDPRYNTPRRPA